MRNVVVLMLASAAIAAETGVIEGEVLNADGTPCGGTQIVVYKIGESHVRRVAETDSAGKFRLADLPPGRYLLRHAPKPKADSPVGEGLGGMLVDVLAETARDASEVAVEAGRTARKDIRLPMRAPVRVVLTRGGKPVVGADVDLFAVNAEGRPFGRFAVGERRLPRTDEDGSASLGEMDEGRYAVELKIDRWSIYAGVHEVKGGDPHSFPIELGEYSVRVKVVDGNGKPVPKAVVSVRWGGRWDWNLVRSRDMRQLVSDDGVYRLPYVHVGRIHVWATGSDSYGGCDDTEVGPGNPEPETVVRLAPTAALVVRVVDRSGTPVPAVHVQVENADDERGTPAYDHDMDEHGEFRQVLVVTRRWRMRIQDSRRGNGEWITVTLSPNEEKVIVLTLPESR